MAGRCGALVVLMAISIPAAAQQQMPPTLRERAAKEGHVSTGAIVDYDCCTDLADLVQHSSLIVRGEVVDFKSRLSDDERKVWTDYTIVIQQIYKQVGQGGFVSDGKIQVTKLGGHLMVDGHPVEYTTEFPPIPSGIPHIFFILSCTDKHCAGPYMFVAKYGAISLENGQVPYSPKPDPVWGLYRGMTADSFISAVKEKVASSIPEGSPK